MTVDSAALGSITIKNLVFPEWWLLCAAAGLLRAARRRIRVPLRPAVRGAARPAHRSDVGGLSAHGLGRGQHHPVRRPRRADGPRPVGRVRVPRLNIVGALLFLGGEQGLSQLARNAVQSVTSFSLTPIPFFVLMGEVLFHSGVALKAIDAFALLIRRVPGRLSVIAIVAGTVFSAISGSTIATTALLGSLMLPTMLDARLRQAARDGADHRHRRRRHADPAVGAGGAARQPRRHFDFRAADRRHRAGPDPERAVRRLHRAARHGSIRRWRRRTSSKPARAAWRAGCRSSSMCCRWC